MANSDLVQSLSRGLDLLQMIVIRAGGISLNEIAGISGLKKTTAHNLLRTLAARGFVARDHRGYYVAGPGFIDLATGMDAAERLRAAEDKMLELAARFPDLVTTFATISGGEVRCLLRVSPDVPGVIQHPATIHYMPYSSASAIALQAANPRAAQALEALYPFEEYGAGIWGDRSRFAAECAAVMRDHCCVRSNNTGTGIAFVMPECYTLAFRGEHGKSMPLEECRRAADDFCRCVWGYR